MKAEDYFVTFNDEDETIIKGTTMILDYDNIWNNKRKRFEGMGIMFTLLTNWKSNERYGVVDFETSHGTNVLVVYTSLEEEEAKDLLEYINTDLVGSDLPAIVLKSIESNSLIKLDIYCDDLDNEDYFRALVSYHD